MARFPTALACPFILQIAEDQPLQMDASLPAAPSEAKPQRVADVLVRLLAPHPSAAALCHALLCALPFQQQRGPVAKPQQIARPLWHALGCLGLTAQSCPPLVAARTAGAGTGGRRPLPCPAPCVVVSLSRAPALHMVQVPRVLTLMGAPSPDLRALAVSTLNQLANVMPGALMDNMDK